MAVACALNVHFAFTKNENVTAQQNATKFDVDWLKPEINRSVKITQCMKVLITPTVAYLENNLSMRTIYKNGKRY